MSAPVLVRQSLFLDSHSTSHGAVGRKLRAITCPIAPVFHAGLQSPRGGGIGVCKRWFPCPAGTISCTIEASRFCSRAVNCFTFLGFYGCTLSSVQLGTEIIARFDAQVADDALVGIEKFSVGGMRTVRGYRENQYVRDNGLIASVEVRIPIWRDRNGRTIAQLAPFFDYGRSWNNENITHKEELASVGVGIRLSPWDWLHGELYWGGRLGRASEEGAEAKRRYSKRWDSFCDLYHCVLSR